MSEEVQSVLDWLKDHSTPKDYANLARFGITTDRAFGVSMANIQKLAKTVGRDHALAEALWKTGWYEARLLTSFVDEPAKVTVAQMDQWCRDFDNWGVCDTLCFKLFDQTPHAWGRVKAWAGKEEEFVKRGAYALLASLALHDKKAADAQFLETLPWVEKAAMDERNFVKKGVNWALRSIGRRNAALNAAAIVVAKRLAAKKEAAPRWVGKDALREFAKVAAKKG